jgi:HSP20 family protein
MTKTGCKNDLKEVNDMPIVRWDPFRDLVRLRDELDRYWPFEKEEVVTWAPRMDIKETDKEIIARMDIPGMKMEDIDVSVNNDTVSISGERKMEKEEKGKDLVRMERAFGWEFQETPGNLPIKFRNT